MEYSVVLSTSDGVESKVECGAETSVLDAAAAAGMVLPSLCRTGSCGACAATVSSGEYRLADHSDAALGASAGEGAVLLCRTFALSDCRVDLPYDRSRIFDAPPSERWATITALETVAQNTVRLEFTYEPDEFGGASAEFEPGQFVQVQLPGREDRRAYSLANIANWDGTLELFVRILPGGLFSTYVTDEAAIGNRLLVHGPQGAFGLHEHGLRPRWFVGGGTGVAPLLSMLRRMAEWGDAQPARLYLGCNTEADVFATAEIEALGGALPDFHHEICVWRPETDSAWAGFVGTPVDALERDLAATEELPDVYVCGPPAMVDAVERAMRAAGVPDEQLIVERFAAN